MQKRTFALFLFLLCFTFTSSWSQTTIDIWEDDYLLTETNIVPLIEKASFGDKLVRSVLNASGEKKSWLKEEVNVKKKRRFDLHEPKDKFFKNLLVERHSVMQTEITALQKEDSESDKLVIYFHGGAFIMGPVKLQWQMIRRVAEETEQKVWMVDYPKAPESSIDEIYENVFATYLLALEDYAAEDIILMGGSSGGNLALSILAKIEEKGMEMPQEAIVYSPFIDYASSNPAIDVIETRDPVLARPGLELVADLMQLEEEKRTDPVYSPIYADISNYPPIHMFVASDDILMPDELRFFDKAVEEGIDITMYLGNEMVHCWAVSPSKTGRLAVDRSIEIIRSSSSVAINEDTKTNLD